jgi:hypothetical protein
MLYTTEGKLGNRGLLSELNASYLPEFSRN